MIDKARKRLAGVWRLTSYQDRLSVEDEWEDTYGVNVDGLIVYDATGWLSIQVSGSDDRYDSYFGRFTIVEAATEHDGAIAGVVRHEVLASSIPELLTAGETRPFRVTGTTLVLGDGETWHRTSRRVSGRLQRQPLGTWYGVVIPAAWRRAAGFVAVPRAR